MLRASVPIPYTRIVRRHPCPPWPPRRIYPVRVCSAWLSTSYRRAAVTQAPPAGERLKLRDYQEECVQTVVAALTEGRRQVGVSLATGSGKTVRSGQLLQYAQQC